jgi:hypothetical protein
MTLTIGRRELLAALGGAAHTHICGPSEPGPLKRGRTPSG